MGVPYPYSSGLEIVDVGGGDGTHREARNSVVIVVGDRLVGPRRGLHIKLIS